MSKRKTSIVRLAKKFPKIKVFARKRWMWRQRNVTKRAAERDAKVLRGYGYKTKILPTGESYWKYCIYIYPGTTTHPKKQKKTTRRRKRKK